VAVDPSDPRITAWAAVEDPFDCTDVYQ